MCLSYCGPIELIETPNINITFLKEYCIGKLVLALI